MSSTSDRAPSERVRDVSREASPCGLLMVANFLSGTGGSRSVMEDLADRLPGSEWKVIATSDKRAGWRRGIDMLATAIRRRRDYRLAVVDVYSGRAFRWAEEVGRFLRRSRKPHLLVLRGGGLPEFAARHGRRVRRLLSGAEAVAAPSGFLLERLRPYRADLRLLPNPLELAAYPFRVRDRPAPKLVWLRSFHAMYNPPLAAEVLARLSGRFPHAELAMVGPDKRDGSLEATRRAAAELGVVERIRFIGAVSKADVPVWLDAGDVFLNTTGVDNTPVSVLEAMACGLCVVSTNVGGIPYILEDGGDSLLVAPGDPEKMASAVERVLTEPGLAERLSRSGRAKAERLDWARILPEWEDLLRSLAGSRS
ncbi:MAG: glycosyltransferase family 4 protein [Thermoanaerobaculia bacterium]